MSLPRAIAVAWLGCIVIGGCATSGAAPRRDAAHAGAGTYVVRADDTLYSIAWRHDLDYRDLARWNRLGADYKITVGQSLMLAPPSDHASARGRSSVPGAAPGRSAKDTVPPPPVRGNGQWVWPTDRLADPRPVPNGGILLLGQLGQDVRAAGAGRVVYTGSGLRGYGNLIIIKHGDGLLSSYAHNREVLVREGEDVARGQVIAHMGTGPHQVAALYFEIRVNGKPTDPLRYLSPR